MNREDELEQLIAEQAMDMKRGHMVWDRCTVISLDTLFNDNPEYYKPRRDVHPKVKLQINPNDSRHGTANGYQNLECRCARCRKANTLWHKGYRERRRRRELHRSANAGV